MRWLFKEKKELSEIEIEIRYHQFDNQIRDFIDYIENYDASGKKEVISIKNDDRTFFIKIDDIILADVYDRHLNIETTEGSYQTSSSLSNFIKEVNSKHFVQISKQTVINIKHLTYTTPSFSGNLLAVLTKDNKVSVSRRYIKHLQNALGI